VKFWGELMNIYYWLLLIIAVLYGGSTILVGVVELKKKRISMISNFIMILGAVLILLISISINILGQFSLYILILGLIMIHASAIDNGFKLHGKITVKHHIVRGIVSILMIALFLLR